MMGIRAAAASVLAVGLLSVLPGVASAWTVQVIGGNQLQADGGPSTDDFVVDETPTAFRIQNVGSTATIIGGGCTAVTIYTVECAKGPIRTINVIAFGGSDAIRVAQGFTPDNEFAGVALFFHGGAGQDFVTVGFTSGGATITGGSGDDDLFGSSHEDVIDGGDGIDELGGDPGEDLLRGDAGNDDINGGLSDDVLRGGPGHDSLDGSLGEDTLIGDDGDDGLSGGSSDDILRGAEGIDSLVGGSSDDVMRGGESGDGFVGGSGYDKEIGGEGGDTFDAGADTDGDYFEGGPGTDSVRYTSRTSGVSVDIGAGGANDGSALDGPIGARDEVHATVENIIGGNGNDILTGNELDNLFEGRGGADVFSGLGGIDTVTYDDRLAGDPVTVVIDGTANDGSATDGPSGARDLVKTDVENLTGGAGADSLKGSALANLIVGGLGADSLFGLGGVDVLNANDGVADAVINCGNGTGETAIVDAFDPPPVSC